MQLYLEGGAWFKKNHPWKKIKFFGYQKERVVKCQQASWPEDDVKPLRSFFLCKAPDFDKGQDCWPPCDSVFIPMCNKRYISKPPPKKRNQISFQKDWFPHVVLSCSPFFWPNFHLECVCMPRLLTCPGFQAHARRSPRRGSFWYSSGAGGPM